MDYDKTKVDEATLALMCLVAFDDGPAKRAWKGFDWDTLDRLHERGWIGDPKSKARSVVLTEEGFRRAEALFQELFGTDSA